MKRIMTVCVLTAWMLGRGTGMAGTPQGQEILTASGIKGGLIVHLGCGDGQLTAALRTNDSFLVHGLDTDAANVAAARKHIQTLGLYGPVSAERWTGDRLPYADNLVNLVVANNLGKLPMDEVMRVLVPNGVALIGGIKTVKPWPKDMDQWSHFLHAADGHHPRCWNDKATDRFIISAKRGIELYDTQGKEHSRNDWVRAMCGVGTIPCNGLIYVPPHYCFCYPGALMNGFLALAAGGTDVERGASSAARLEHGPAYGSKHESRSTSLESDWPTYRRDAIRSGATTTPVPVQLTRQWSVALGGKLTQPVVVGEMLLVAAGDAHTLFARDTATGRPLWSFVAGGRLDTPPTVHEGRVLLGCHDGWVYCLRASDGALAWRFRAAPQECWICDRGRIASPWPVQGGVLVKNGLAYVVAGRSSFLDGGLFLYALDPITGRKIHETRLDGPWPDLASDAGSAHHMDGALADVLVSGAGAARDYVYLRQIKLDAALREQAVPWVRHEPVLKKGINYLGQEESSYPSIETGRGIKETGLHLFATWGFLDDSYHDRTGWMFAKTWPGWTFFNFAPKAGQLVVFDEQRTFAVQQFTQRQIRSPAFVAGRDGYLLTADANDHEPELKPEHRFLHQRSPGFTRSHDLLWKQFVPVRVRAMVLAGPTLFVAGPPDIVPDGDPLGAFEGRRGAKLRAVSPADGKKLHEIELPAPPVFDGMAASHGKLYLSTTDGHVTCFGKQE